MGMAFSSNLIQSRIRNTIGVAISVLDQCQQTFNQIQGLMSNNCPGLFLAGLNFSKSEIITERCFHNDTTLTQLETSVSNYLQEQADLDIIKYKLTDSQGKIYQQLISDLSILIITNTVKFTEEYFKNNSFICKNSPNIRVEVVNVPDLNRFLTDKVFESVINTNGYTDLVNFFKTTEASQQRNLDLLTVSMLIIITFLVLLCLIFLGISCGWVIVASLIIFFLLEISISFTIK